jgi:Glycoside-hydrolase family GH114
MMRVRAAGVVVAVLAAVGAVGGAGAVAAHGETAGARAGGGGGVRAGAVWQPGEDTDWMWELSQRLVLTNPRLMGTGVKAWNGDTSPGDNPKLYDIDAIDNPASTVAALHQDGDHVVCYIEVGTAGNYYSAAQEGIPVTYYQQLKNAGDLGKKIKGYPEYFVDINAPSAVAIIKAMIKKQCAAKSFDGVETDLDETFGGNEGKTGFTITQADEENYLTTLADYMHGLGLAWIAKNLDDTQDASFVDAMAPLAQGIISEQCNQYHTCTYLKPFLTAGKWIGNAEYSLAQSKFCASDNAAGMNGVLFNVNLDGGRNPCR